MKIILLYVFLGITLSVSSQPVNDMIWKGNEAYRSGEYDKAEVAYKKVLEINRDNTTALFNLGNTLFKKKQYDDAINAYDKAAVLVEDPILKAKLYYNKGVVLTQENKLEESIAAYKQSLRINNADTLARENLQRALQERPPKESLNQEIKPKEERVKSDKLSKQQVEELLKDLEEQEQNLQNKKKKKSVSTDQPTKDW